MFGIDIPIDIPISELASFAAGATVMGGLAYQKGRKLYAEGKDVFLAAERLRSRIQAAQGDGTYSKVELEAIGEDAGTLAGEVIEFRDAAAGIF